MVRPEFAKLLYDGSIPSIASRCITILDKQNCLKHHRCKTKKQKNKNKRNCVSNETIIEKENALNKKLALLLAASTASTAFAAFDLKINAASGYSLSRTGTVTGNVAADATDGPLAKVDGAVLGAWSTSGLLNSFGGGLTGMYCVMDNLFIGLNAGVQWDLAFADKHSVTGAPTWTNADSKNGTEAAELEVAAADQFGRSYLFIPIQLVLHYDIVAPMDNMNVYFEVAGGWSYAMDMSTKGLKDSAHFTLAPTNAIGSSWTVEAALGLEYYGVGLSAGYNLKLAGAASADADAVLKTHAFAYSHHMISVGLHYRLSNLF